MNLLAFTRAVVSGGSFVAAETQSTSEDNKRRLHQRAETGA